MNAFPKKAHLRSPKDFARVYQVRRSVSDDWLIIYGCRNDLGFPRLGLSVSRKVGPAVRRNRLRRLYREAFRLTCGHFPDGLDIVIIPRSANEPTLEILQTTLPRLVKALARKLNREASV